MYFNIPRGQIGQLLKKPTCWPDIKPSHLGDLNVKYSNV